jgi:hypothetical protein
MQRAERRRRGDRRRRASITAVLGRPAPALAFAYPGYRTPEPEHRTRAAIGGAALLHGALIAVLFALAALAPKVEDRVLQLRFLEPEPPPPPVEVEVPKPEPPPPPPVQVELPKPKPVLPKPPPPKPMPKLEPAPPPPKPVVKPPPVVKPAPLMAAPPLAMPAPAPAPARVARTAPVRESAVRLPAAQIDRTARPDFSDATPAATHRPALAPARAERSVRPPPAAIDRVAAVRPEVAPAAPAPRAAPPPSPAARAERPAMIAPKPSSGPRNQLRGVALSELLPCVSDARELSLKQKTVAAAQNRSLCESPAGRFHFVETKNVNAFLMRIEQAAGRQSGDRCSELQLALDCIASLPPPRSRR